MGPWNPHLPPKHTSSYSKKGSAKMLRSERWHAQMCKRGRMNIGNRDYCLNPVFYHLFILFDPLFLTSCVGESAGRMGGFSDHNYCRKNTTIMPFIC